MQNTSFEWAVIGAGPAGIAAVGNLLDAGIKPQTIAWIDPEFKVGDFGSKWRKVPSNTKVKVFLKFYNACKAFQYAAHHPFSINNINPEETCSLDEAAEPLRWITEHLKNTVHVYTGEIQHLQLSARHWHLTFNNTIIQSRNVILAIGAHPKSPPFTDKEIISLETALDPDKLQLKCNANDTIGVFGSSHSSILILKSLLEQDKVKNIINFYLKPLRYAVFFNDWILFDDTGLKGKAALWARENIDGNIPTKLQRFFSNDENLHTYLPQCTKVIYATGFKSRHISIEGIPKIEYNDKNGIIAPGLFGLGIAFPEGKHDRLGTLEHRVGLWKFMEYAQRVMPIWLQYSA